MKTTALLAALMLAAAPALVSTAAYAAHAGAPYKNVDKKNDAGNDTGDSKVDELNAAQLDKNYKGQNMSDKSAMPMTSSGMPMKGSTMPMSGSSMPMNGSSTPMGTGMMKKQ